MGCHRVEFDLGEHGTRIFGEIYQYVEDGFHAVAPVVKANEGWVFKGWDTSFDYVTSDMTVTALYRAATAANGDYAVNIALGSIEAADAALTLAGEAWCTGANAPSSLTLLANLTWSVWGSDEDGANAVQVWSGSPTFASGDAFTITFTPNAAKAQYWVRVTEDTTSFDAAPLPAPKANRPVAVIDAISPDELTDAVETVFTGHGTNGTIVAYRWTARRLESGVAAGGETLLGVSQVTAATLPAGDWRIAFAVQNEDEIWSEAVTRDVSVASALPKADLAVSSETLSVRDERALAVAVANVGATMSVSFQVANAGDAESASGAMAYLFDGDGRETTDELLALTESHARVLGAVPLGAIAAGGSTDVSFSWTVGQNAAGVSLSYGDEVRLLTVVVVPAASSAERTTANNIVRKGFGVGGKNGVESISDDLDSLLGVTLRAPNTVCPNDPFTLSGKAVYTLGSTAIPAAGLSVTLTRNGAAAGTTVTDATGAYSFTFRNGLSTVGSHAFVVTVTDGGATATASAQTQVTTAAEQAEPRCDIVVSALACVGDDVRQTSGKNYASCPGEEVSVEVTLKNQASQTAGAFNVRVSASRVGASEPTYTETYRVAAGLAYGATTKTTIALPQATVLQTTGNWIVSVSCDVGGELDESNEMNNYASCRLAVEVKRPDLTVAVKEMTRSKRVLGDTLVARVLMTNNGPGLVTNAFAVAVTQGSSTLAEVAVDPTFAPNESRTVEIEIPTETLFEGINTLVFTVDPHNAVDEANESNNSVYEKVWLYSAAPQFLAGDARLTARPSPSIGETCTLQFTIVNSGGSRHAGGRVVFTIDGTTYETTVGALEAFGGANTAKVQWTPNRAGTVYVQASFYGSGSSALLSLSGLFPVAEQPVPAPNLTVASSGLTISPAQITVNSTVQFTATVANEGDKAASNASVVFVLKDDRDNSHVVATKSGLTIAAGAKRTLTATYANIAAGKYVLEVTASDSDEPEGLSGGNTASRSFSVGMPLPVFASNADACVIGEAYTIDASASCWSTTYEWTLLSAPEGSATTLALTSAASRVSFTPDVKGDYLFSLRTRYGDEISLPAEMRLSASLRRLTASAGVGGTISPNGSVTWPDGETAAVVASPLNDWFRFAGWRGSLDGATQTLVDGVATCLLPMTSNRVVVADFERCRFRLTYENLYEAANPNPAFYDLGQAFDFQPLADTDDWAFTGWDVSGVTADMARDLVVTASWRYKGSVVTETGWYLDGSRLVYGPYTTYLHTNVLQTVALADAALTNGQTRYVCTGYRATFGETTLAGSAATFDLVPLCDGSVTWLYETNHWFEAAAADTNGTISCSEAGWKVRGTTETIVCAPAAHYHVAYVTGTGASGCTVSNNVVTVPMTAPRVIKVNFALDTFDVTYDPGEHGAFDAGVSPRLPRRQSVGWGHDATTPALTPDRGWRFVGWDGAATDVTESLTLHALYEAIVYNIAYEDPTGAARGVANPNGDVTNYSAAATVTFRNPRDLWDLKFDGWTPPNTAGCVGDLTVTANWSRIPATIQGLPGTTAWYVGDTVRETFVTPSIADGTRRDLVSWRVTTGTNDTVVAEGSGTNVAFTVAANAPYRLESTWSTKYWLEVAPATNGTLTCSAPGGWLPDGTNVTFVATPDEDYSVARWTGDVGDGSMQSNRTVLTLAMTRPRTVGVAFEPTPYTITYDAPWEFARANTNRTRFTKNDAFAFGPLADVANRRFLRWEPAGIEEGTRSNVTAKAVWTWRYGNVTFGENLAATNRTIVGNSVYHDFTTYSPNDKAQYVCTNWTVWNGTNAVAQGTNATCRFTIPFEGDYHVSADAWQTNYLLTATWSNGGSVSGLNGCAWYAAGSTVELVAEADDDYEFLGWQDDTTGLEGLTEPRLTVLMDRPRDLFAWFSRPHLDLGEAVNATNLAWRLEGDSFWTAAWDASAPDGRHDAQSPAVRAGQSAQLVATFGGKGELSFAWRWTGSETSNVVRLVVDGVEERRLDAATPWQTVTVALGFGRHEVGWLVEATDPAAANDGVASLDQVTWLSRGEDPLDVTLEEALNVTNGLTWTTGGDVAWQANVTEFAYEGGAAAYAGLMGANQTGYLATTVQGPGRVSFAWQNSAPDESAFTLAVDGKTVLTNAGETGWTTAWVDVEGDGAHTLKWICRVGEIDANSMIGGCGALDYVRWTPGTAETLAARPLIEKADTQEFYAWLAAKKQIATPTTDPVVSKKVATIQTKADEVVDNGKGMTLLEEFVAGTDPTDPDDVFHAEITVGADGLPEVKWEPQLNAGEAKTGKRRYRIYGSNEMTDPASWPEVESTENCRFFRVSVELP